MEVVGAVVEEVVVAVINKSFGFQLHINTKRVSTDLLIIFQTN